MSEDDDEGVTWGSAAVGGGGANHYGGKQPFNNQRKQQSWRKENNNDYDKPKDKNANDKKTMFQQKQNSKNLVYQRQDFFTSNIPKHQKDQPQPQHDIFPTRLHKSVDQLKQEAEDVFGKVESIAKTLLEYLFFVLFFAQSNYGEFGNRKGSGREHQGWMKWSDRFQCVRPWTPSGRLASFSNVCSGFGFIIYIIT